MLKPHNASITSGPMRTKTLALVAAALSIAFLFDRFLMPAQPARWHPVTVEFCGFTNLSSGKCAILAIQNQSPKVLKLNNLGYTEFYQRPILGSGNDFRRYATGSNFVFQVGQRKNLTLPVSEEGGSWNVVFVFTRTGLQAELAEYLQKPHGMWVEVLPEILRNPWQIELRFYLNSKALART
jgi:hypothetical protein